MLCAIYYDQEFVIDAEFFESNGLTDMVGASHCQEGQGGTIYKIRKVRDAGKMVSNAIRQGTYKSKKSKRNGGRSRKKKMNKRKVLTRKRINNMNTSHLAT